MNLVAELTKYGKFLHEKGFVIGAGGNISVKDGDHIIIKKKGVDMSIASPRDYMRIPLVEESKQKNAASTELPFHLACYQARKDVGSVIHVHHPMMVAVANRADGISRNISYEFEIVMASSAPSLDYLQPGSEDLAVAVSDKLREGANAVLLKKHGAISVGKDLPEAFQRILALERACSTFLYML